MKDLNARITGIYIEYDMEGFRWFICQWDNGNYDALQEGQPQQPHIEGISLDEIREKIKNYSNL